jgi:redox-sensitive bicupin YhaK (pirin superfamily)
MVQLWVNLPAKDKTAPPRYQSISNQQIPTVALADNRGVARVIAGEFGGVQGPAKTFTPMHVWDLRLTSDERIDLPMPDGWTTVLVVLKGTVRLNGSEPLGGAELGLFDRPGNRICFDGANGTNALVLCGEPIHEPIVGMGPFVMNTEQEIRQAMLDYQSGKMGHLP